RQWRRSISTRSSLVSAPRTASTRRRTASGCAISAGGAFSDRSGRYKAKLRSTPRAFALIPHIVKLKSERQAHGPPPAPPSVIHVLATRNGVGAAAFTVHAAGPGIRAGVDRREQGQGGKQCNQGLAQHRSSPKGLPSHRRGAHATSRNRARVESAGGLATALR